MAKKNKTLEFIGCYVPLITPFSSDGKKVNEEMLRRLVNYYIEEHKVTGLVPCGTTGESCTLSNDEHVEVIKIVVDENKGRVPIIAGTGSNSTQEAIDMTKHAQDLGVDATLQVCPYYNRPQIAGIKKHFEEIARATKLPIILYNIPKRTGINMPPSLIIELAKVDGIVGLKDCSCDFNQTMEIIQATKNNKKPFYVLTGEDVMTFSTVAAGGHGAIAAVGHVVGKEYVQMIDLLLQNKITEARDIHYKTLDIAKTLFIEANPAPIKEALTMMGFDVGPVRLPLVALSSQSKEVLRSALTALGKIK